MEKALLARQKDIIKRYKYRKPLLKIANEIGVSLETVRQTLIKAKVYKSAFTWTRKLSQAQKYTIYGLPKHIREAVFKRDGYLCQYCRGESGDKVLTIDHVLSKRRGGSHKMENLITACNTCNGRKGKKTLTEWKNEKIKIPA